MNKFSSVGHNIKLFREQFNITQQELANKVNQAGYDLDITQAYISALEKSRGEKLPSVPVLVALAEVLETSIDALLGLNPARSDDLDLLPADLREPLEQLIRRLAKERHAGAPATPIHGANGVNQGA